MTLRIVEEQFERGPLLRVAGDLSGSALSELESSCLNAKPPLTLDLEDVISVDEHGIVVLRALAAEGAKLVGASPYLSMRLGLERQSDPDKHSGAGNGNS